LTTAGRRLTAVRARCFNPAMLHASARLAATYSIVARDPETGEIGVGVQSHYFSVGSAVPWAQPGVGAVATQSILEVSYGPKGLAKLSAGEPAESVLAALVEQDAGRALRQVAVLDAEGRSACHSGALCVPAFGHAQGRGWSAQGNMLRSDAVWQGMGPAYERSRGSLAERLLAALEAAEAAGGDVRGRQSAAILVVAGERPANPWEGRLVDLHVEHHAHPLEELRRLLDIHRAHRLFEEARGLFGSGAFERAVPLLEEARKLQPDDVEFAFWTGVAFANAGRKQEARRWLREAYAADASWRELARRLAQVGLFSGGAELIES
jgi:uncharacterized Ntn-hydrolase superfamily protein